MEKTIRISTTGKALRILLAVALALSTLALPSIAWASDSAYISVGDDISYAGYATSHMWADGEQAYCVEPAAATPAEGSYTKHAVDDTTLIAALWFSYGAPGFDKSMWPDSWYDGSDMTSAKYLCAGHVLLSYIYQGSFDAATYGTSSDFQDWAGDELFGTTLDKIKVNKSKVGGGFSAFLIYTGDTQDMLSFKYNPCGGVRISKQDTQTGTDEQGDATFEGATFAITNESEYAVYVEGKLYEPGEVVKEITTDADGVAQTSADCLPYGSYRIEETVPPVGYLNQGTVERDFQVREEGVVVDLTESAPIVNDVVRGGVMVEKDDIELGKSEAIGGADHSSTVGANLNGIEFTIVNESAHRVIVNGESYDPGQAVLTITTAWNDSEQAYTAQTAGDALPYGTYTIQETKTNDAYLLTDGEPKTFQVRKEGVIVKAEPDGDDLTFSDQVIRQDLRVTKKAAGASNASLQVPFKITNMTTGESHVICTDRNGDFSTASDWNAHSNNTNANDKLIVFDGTITADDMDSRAGIWFGLGEDGSMAAVDDSLAALPYGEYRLAELRCEANEGYQLIDKTFWVERDSTVAEPIWMSLTDEEAPGCHTEAVDASDGDHVLQASEKATITDTVYYENLEVGKTYTVTGTLMVKQTGEALIDAEGNPVTATTEFECKASNGTVDVTFEFDASMLAGKTLVAFEEVTHEGVEVCAHEDIDDADQSVTVVETSTPPTDVDDSPDTPETTTTPYDKTGATAPDNEGNALSILCFVGAALLGAGAATLGRTFARRKKDDGDAEETSTDDNDEEAEE